MPGPKKMTPAPIDRPLSRAYLRQFTGWSTAYPPGLSQPTSLRIMENLMVTRDGAVRIRPGMRKLFSGFSSALQGSHEAFYLDDGTKAYLVAVKETDGTIGFRVLRFGASTAMTLAAAGFTGAAQVFTAATSYVKFVQIDNKVLALSNAGESAILFHVGSAKRIARPQALPAPGHAPGAAEPPPAWKLGTHAVLTGATPGSLGAAGTLSAGSTTTASMALFFAFANEFGEAAASEISSFRIARPWQAWRWGAPDPTTGAPTATLVTDPRNAADQIVAFVDAGDYAAAVAAGATHLNFYVAAWTDDAEVPTTAVLMESKPITGLDYDHGGFVQITPGVPLYNTVGPMPNAANRRNYSVPPTGGQGLVASDRLVVVNDPTNAAVVKWTANQQGDYLNFSASKGGGYKTLTSGNMQVPACVKLWQNPQSVDTLTVLCRGTDGHSTAYYMAPSSISQQSESTTVMGFEETTATPGTVSPYGCEVFNNALYHPLDDQLMKSTANNYNIAHKSQTETVRNMWELLLNKQRIVSSQLDGRLYYLVHNPANSLESGCWGNEIWVYDASGPEGTWSRWLVQAKSLRKLEGAGGRVYMSVARPDGLYILDPDYAFDDMYGTTAPIRWRMTTNTQGANRAHDAWAHLQQADLVVGNFTGVMRYGISGWDVHGQPVDISKVVRDDNLPGSKPTWDLEDYLLVRKDMKEWFFYAESVEEEGVLQPSAGQISLVQYRYAPVSVNVGYEYGSIETFEYGAASTGDSSTTTNGVPTPYIDTRRP